MLRELTYEELNHVSGGDDDGEGGILVNGVRERSGDAVSRIAGAGMGVLFLGGTSQYVPDGLAVAPPSLSETVDNDGNGEIDEIIVDAPDSSNAVNVGPGLFAVFTGADTAYLFRQITVGIWPFSSSVLVPIGARTYTVQTQPSETETGVSVSTDGISGSVTRSSGGITYVWGPPATNF